MKKFCLSITILIGLFFILPEKGHSIPAFARKYGFNCNMCHTSFTKLNDFGQIYRDNGYQIPGQQGLEKNVFEIAPPVSIRTSTGSSIYHTDDRTTFGANIYGFDFLSAGVLHKNVSFLLIYKPRVDEPAADFTGPGLYGWKGRNPSQLGSLESVNIVFSNLIRDKLSVRIGRFEPAYQAFSSKRSFYFFEPYEVYAFTTPVNTFTFEDNQIGLEMTGHLRTGFKYALGAINGTGANPDNNTYKDYYINLLQVLGKGEGQSAGQRIGAFGYLGYMPVSGPPSFISPTGETDGYRNQPFYRFGGDLSLNWKTLNLQAFFLAGIDDKALNYLHDRTKDYKYTGGLAQLDCAALFNNRFIASVLYNWVTPPSYDDDRTINAYSALVRYYLGDWTAVNVALHAEFTHKRTGKTDPLKENLFSLLVDFDF
ncbi:MAG: hypothetical protein MUP17_12565 [candidate division Zixibacteria bacterium]|nr:hypothetical protein [candidate division Zixibacteria bacterium]